MTESGASEPTVKKRRTFERGLRRVLISLLLFWGGYMALFMYFTRSYTTNAIEMRRGELQRMVNLGFNSISPIIENYKRGALSREKALTAVRDRIRLMTYDDAIGKNYLFMSSYSGIMLVQPYEPEKEGTNQWDLRDDHGTYIIRELVKTATSPALEGFVTYHYPHPITRISIQKLSFVKGIPELQCYLGTGLYVDDIHAENHRYAIKSFILTIVLILFIFVIISSFFNPMMQSYRMLLKLFKKIAHNPFDLPSIPVDRFKPDSDARYILEGFRDMIDRIRASRSRELTSEERFRSFFENSKDAVFITSKEGQIININRAACDMLHYSIEEFSKISAYDIYADASTRTELLAAIEREGFVKDFHTRLKTRDGKMITVEVSANAVRDKDGNVIEYQGIMKDVTQQKFMEEQLRQSHKLEAIGQLAGGIAHDFNNILTIILGNAELAMMHAHPGTPIFRELNEIKKAGESAANIIRQLLAFSRKQMFKPKLLNVNTVLSELYLMLKRLIGENIEFTLNTNKAIGSVNVDRAQLEQVIINLIVNARDAIQDKNDTTGTNRIVIETDQVRFDKASAEMHVGSSEGEHVMIAISDTGIGMEKTIVEHIFDPFFTTKEPQKGTGLGLSTAFGIIKQNNGSIFVYSELHSGTTFKIYLPLAETGPATAVSVEQAAAVRPHGSETILVVEDEDSLRIFASRALKQQGYTIIEARNGKEALAMLRSRGANIDLIFTDLITPELNGKELALQALREKPSMKILFTSGYPDNFLADGELIDPEKNFLQKPYTIQSLTNKIREVLDRD